MKIPFKKNKIQFDGTKEIENRAKNQIDNVISRRFKILIIFICAISSLFLLRLFMTQISQKEYYETKLVQYDTDMMSSDTLRGSIYDRNYKRLVYNQIVNCATYYAVSGISEEEIQTIVNFLIDNVNIDVSKVSKREKKDYLIMKDKEFTDSLVSQEERERYKDDENATDIINDLILQRMTDKVLKEHLSDDDIRYYKLYYAIRSCKSGSTVLIEGLSVKEASLIGENSQILRGIKVTNDWQRAYEYGLDFKSVLGTVTTKKEGLPATSKNKLLALDYRNDARVGISGLEAQYEDLLKGQAGTYQIQYDQTGSPEVTVISEGQRGENIRLTIDWEIQAALSKAIEDELKSHTGYSNRYNNNIFVTIINPNNGDIIAMAGKRRDEKTGEIYDYAAGNYLSAFACGSSVKGATLYTAFKNNIITPGTIFNDQPMVIKGTPVKKSVRNYGYINEVQALEKSSNVYMFNVAIRLGKGSYSYGESLGITRENLNSAFDTFKSSFGELGLGVKTGLDVPNETLGYRSNRDPEAGHLLDFSIGQYDTYTNIQLAQYISTIANGGKKIQPHLFLDSFEYNDDNEVITLHQHQTKILDDVSHYKTAFDQIHKGMRACLVSGTGSSANSEYRPAGKTGTAEVYDYSENKDYPNHIFVGYAPYEDPQIAVSCITERQSGGRESCKPLSKVAFDLYFKKYGIKSE